MKGSTFIGADVENPQGQDLGDIKAVVSFGGFLGPGERLFAIPWGAFSQATNDRNTFILDVSKERLSNAPGFDQNN